jgi:hypothetical protein
MTSRRKFIRNILAIIGVAAIFPTSVKKHSAQRSLLLLNTPLAGYQYHQADQLFPLLRVGQSLELKREIDNRHDEKAVAVYWRDQKLGYVQRGENIGISQMMDRGEKLYAVIDDLKQSENPWERVGLEISCLT